MLNKKELERPFIWTYSACGLKRGPEESDSF